MPVKKCEINDKPGFKWGDAGKCYTYNPLIKNSDERARKKAEAQGIAIGEYFKEFINNIRKFRHKIKTK